MEDVASLSSQISAADVLSDGDDPVRDNVDGVQIIPPSMVFSNAYDGKEFKHKLVIRNVGKRVAFLRICPPTSEAFRVKTIDRGCYLASGLKIERNVCFKYTTPLGISHGYMPIFINSTWINYKFSVTLSAAVISIDPLHLDFGRVDADRSATVRTLTIRNDGHKGTNFAIDLGRNPLEIIVHPMKGTIPAMASVTLMAELSGFKEGEFAEDIWIKTTPLMRVVVSGVFIAPTLKVRDFQSTLQFSLMDFGRTYYGATTTKPLAIHNYSSSNSIFYVMAEVQGQTIPLEEAKKINDDYKSVCIRPYDGRLYANRGSVVQITFAPVRVHKKSHRKYVCCFLRIIRMNYRDVTPGVFSDAKTAQAEHDPLEESGIVLPPSSSGKSDVFDSMSAIVAGEDNNSNEASTRVCIHGEMEEGRISIRPDLLVLNDLELSRIYQRELFIENQSSHLPIVVRYAKVASIDVFPNQFELKPKGTIEIKLIIRTSKLGVLNPSACVHFDLFFYDLPKDVYNLRKVGSECVKMQIYTKNVSRKEPKCCLANVNAKEKIPQLDYENNFKLSDEDFVRKYENRVYYRNYLRKNRGKLRISDEVFQDYELTDVRLLMARNIKIGDCAITSASEKRFSVFIPLAPRHLHNIRIYPRYFKLRKAAAFTKITESFTIENLNEFPVRFFCKPSKRCISFANDSRVVVPAKEKRQIPFVFSSFSEGKYNINIDVIVNESHVFQIATLAQVVPKTIFVDCTEVHFEDADDNFKFVKLENRINSSVGFKWDLPVSCFDVQPIRGVVPPERSMFCMVSYHPDPTQADSIECTVDSESGKKKLVQISHKKTTLNVGFANSCLNVGLIPLNREIFRTATLQNFGKDPVTFNIAENCPLAGIEVTPTSGILPGKGTQVFTVRILIKGVIKFRTEVVVDIQQNTDVKLEITGEIDFPKISITPEFMKFRKIYIYSYSRLVFQLVNISKCDVIITFNLEDYPEFTISSDEDNHLPHIDEFSLDPGEVKLLFLHCRPLNISTYALYLPIVLNGIIGPSFVNDQRTIHSKYFLDDFEYSYQSLLNVEKFESQMLSLTKINCYAIDKAVSFSNLDIKFLVFGRDHYNNKDKETFEIINETDQPVEICIRTDDLQMPFELIPIEAVEDFEMYDLSFVFKISPEARGKFSVIFEPSSHGKYFLKMPIFVRGHDEHRIYNYLRIYGEYKEPSIVSHTKSISFEPIPRKVLNIFALRVDVANHFDDCVFNVKCEVQNVYGIFPEGRTFKMRHGEVCINVHFCSMSDLCLNSKLEVVCSCGGFCEVFVNGVVENCTLTCHGVLNPIKNFQRLCNPDPDDMSDTAVTLSAASSMSILGDDVVNIFENRNENNFPIFPKDDDDSDYAQHSRQVLDTLENWLYSQGFFLKSCVKIPDDFFTLPADNNNEVKEVSAFRRAKSEPKMPDLRLVELIINLTGNSVRKTLITTEQPKSYTEDLAATLTFIYTTYLNIINFLTNLGAFMPQVSPENLLSYELYQEFQKVKEQPDSDLTREDFHRLSTQNWVDLLVQLIKVLVLFRMNLTKHEITNLHEINQVQGYHHRLEDVLIDWMNDCLAKSSQFQQIKRKVKHFDDDMKDGIVFGAITSCYCPYVGNFIKEMYIVVENDEDRFHNACCLVQTWRFLGISYEITPEKIALNPNNLEMYLLSLYLFEVLPNFLPKDIVTIGAPLSKRNHAEISLSNNNGDIPIVYKVSLFKNDDACFIVEQDLVKIAPKQTVRVKVTYFAKRLVKTGAILVFGGESPGRKFSSTVTFELVGIPDVTCYISENEAELKMYDPRLVTFGVQSPYKGEVSYSAFIGYKPAHNFEDLIPLEVLNAEKMPAMVKFPSEMRVADKNGKFQTNPFVNCVAQGRYDIFVYYSNKELGDFGTKFSLVGSPNKKKYEMIEVTLSKDFYTGKCGCKGNMFRVFCAKLVKVPIPCRNQIWWKSSKTMLLNNLEPGEKDFWEELLATSSGPRILNLIQSTECSSSFADAFLGPWLTTYNVIVADSKSPFVAEKTLEIDDVTSEESVTLLVHATGDLEGGKKGTLIKLESACGKEVRLYKVVFK